MAAIADGPAAANTGSTPDQGLEKLATYPFQIASWVVDAAATRSALPSRPGSTRPGCLATFATPAGLDCPDRSPGLA